MIQSFKINNIIALLMLLGTFTFQACDDNDSYDITGNPNNLAYIKINGQANNQLIYTVTKTPVSIISDINGKFPVRILHAVGENMTIKVEQDNSMLDTYNADYRTSLLAVPDGLLSVNNTNLTIERGTTISTDSISFTTNESMLSSLEVGKTYLLPLRITSLSSNNVQVSSNMGCVYVLIKTEYQVARVNGGAADMLGALISSYTGWTYTSDHTTGSIANIWTTSTSQRMAFTADPATIIFDMQTVKKISGVRISTRNSSSGVSYQLSNAKMALSTDGANFEDIADLTRTQMAYASSYQYICMYASIEARYLKLEMDFASTSTSYWSLVNLGVYAE